MGGHRARASEGIGDGVIPRGLVARLGVGQLVCWGVSYYAIGVFGERMRADLGWSSTLTHGGFSAALLAMGISSPWVGRAIDKHGGRWVMSAGSFLTALGCMALALARSVAPYYAAWICVGLAMRMTLYEAAFASLAHIGGASARRPISQITLLGGLASTVFWPIGHALANALGWRTALIAYAGFALLTLPLHLAIPPAAGERAAGALATGGAAATRGDRVLAGTIYALIATLTTSLNTGMSAHMIAILTGLGVGASLAVWTATLRGVGQSSARLCEVLFGSAASPLGLGVLSTAMLPVCFVAGLFSGVSPAAAVTFAFVYGAGNGLVTIVRGTLPLVLFDPAAYGRIVGGLLMPSFLVSALAPLAYAIVIDRHGEGAALWLSAALSAIVLAGALVLRVRFGERLRRR